MDWHFEISKRSPFQLNFNDTPTALFLLRSKDTYFRDEAAVAAAKEKLIALVEAEMNPVDPELEERRPSNSSLPDEAESSSSIFQSIRKKIWLDKAREVSSALLLLLLSF